MFDEKITGNWRWVPKKIGVGTLIQMSPDFVMFHKFKQQIACITMQQNVLLYALHLFNSPNMPYQVNFLRGTSSPYCIPLPQKAHIQALSFADPSKHPPEFQLCLGAYSTGQEECIGLQ